MAAIIRHDSGTFLAARAVIRVTDIEGVGDEEDRVGASVKECEEGGGKELLPVGPGGNEACLEEIGVGCKEEWRDVVFSHASVETLDHGCVGEGINVPSDSLVTGVVAGVRSRQETVPFCAYCTSFGSFNPFVI